MKKGRHPERVLSAVKVRNASRAGRYTDGNGLYLVVDPSGAKRWLLRTIVRGRRRDIGLGSATLVGLAEARESAAIMRKIARSGGDPLAEKRRAQRVTPTFEEAARSVHNEHTAAWKNPKHKAQWINTLRDYVFPHIGERRVDQLGTPDVLRVLSPIWLTKPETARRVKQRIGTVFDWAKAAGFCTTENPVRGVSKGLPRQSDRREHHKALPYAELPTFISDLRQASVSEIVQLAFEFLILTAARTNEVLGARWEEIYIKSALWTVPAERMKSGREHQVPLSRRALEIVKRARAMAPDGEHIFPSPSGEKPLSNMVFLMALRRMERQITAHGFRSAFRDWAAERTNFP
jgi:integrase